MKTKFVIWLLLALALISFAITPLLPNRFGWVIVWIFVGLLFVVSALGLTIWKYYDKASKRSPLMAIAFTICIILGLYLLYGATALALTSVSFTHVSVGTPQLVK